MRYIVRERFFHLGEDNDILNEAGQPAFRVDGKALSLHNLMIVHDLNGAEVARVSRQLISLLPQYHVEFADGTRAEIHKHFSPLHQKWTIHVDGQDELEISGNFMQHDYTITHAGAAIATISRQWVSMTATYGVDVAAGANDLLVLCSVLALEAEQTQSNNSR